QGGTVDYDLGMADCPLAHDRLCPASCGAEVDGETDAHHRFSHRAVQYSTLSLLCNVARDLRVGAAGAGCESQFVGDASEIADAARSAPIPSTQNPMWDWRAALRPCRRE